MIHTTRIKNVISKKSILIGISLMLIVMLASISAVANIGNNEIPTEPTFTMSEDITPHYMHGAGLYIDSHFVAAADSTEDINNILNKVMNAQANMLSLTEDATLSFDNTIEIREQDYELDMFSNDIVSLLGYVDEKIVSNEIHSYKDELLPVKLNLKSVVTKTDEVVLPYETKTVFTDMLGEGLVKTIQRGYNGLGLETSQTTYINGVQTNVEVISLEVTEQPIREEQYVGTRAGNKTVASLGGFTKPYNGYVSSPMGSRWGKFHKGIDITGNHCNGKPGVAACDGKVTFAGWDDGYGYHVVIDHGNGIKTLYAHFQKCTVKTGDRVKAGDTIGIIGSTGNSTGPHIHFEVLVEGEHVNPLLFVDYE